MNVLSYIPPLTEVFSTPRNRGFTSFPTLVRTNAFAFTHKAKALSTQPSLPLAMTGCDWAPPIQLTTGQQAFTNIKLASYINLIKEKCWLAMERLRWWEGSPEPAMSGAWSRDTLCRERAAVLEPATPAHSQLSPDSLSAFVPGRAKERIPTARNCKIFMQLSEAPF